MVSAKGWKHGRGKALSLTQTLSHTRGRLDCRGPHPAGPCPQASDTMCWCVCAEGSTERGRRAGQVRTSDFTGCCVDGMKSGCKALWPGWAVPVSVPVMNGMFRGGGGKSSTPSVTGKGPECRTNEWLTRREGEARVSCCAVLGDRWAGFLSCRRARDGVQTGRCLVSLYSAGQVPGQGGASGPSRCPSRRGQAAPAWPLA